MNSAEKLEKMFKLEKPNDRSEIPYFPMILTWAGTCAGITQREMLEDLNKNIEALDITFSKIGNPDAMMATSLLDTTFVMTLPVKLPGRDLGDDDLYQFIEEDLFSVPDGGEYDKILQMGYQNWNGMMMMQIQEPPMTDPQQLMGRWGQLANNCGIMAMHFLPQGIMPITFSACAPVFDNLSQLHTMEQFSYDLYDYPEKIKAVLEAGTPEVIGQAIGTAKQSFGTRIGVYAMRSSATFISPDTFYEIAWPSLKAMILAFWEAGMTTILHADGNWLPMLEFFTEVPKYSVHFEFDGSTDIRKAYEILGGWHSMRGDVPAAMLAYGTADEVSEYCENLITDLGMKGGFMLGSGCEVPKNAKFECVKAMGDSLKK